MNVEAEKLVLNNTNLVYVIAKKYISFMPWDDILQYGMLGLCKAADRFDPSKGKFKDYSAIYIEGTIQMAIRDCSGWIGDAKGRSKGECIKPITFTDCNNSKDSDTNQSVEARYGTFLESVPCNAHYTMDDMATTLDVLHKLTPREQFVARGLLTGYSMRVIGEALGITPQRVYQIKLEIGDKLRKEYSKYEFDGPRTPNKK